MTATTMTTDFADALIAETPALQRFAWRRTGRNDLAEDLVQETLLRAWSNQDKFREGTNMGAWLSTILRNTHISHVRKHKREQVGLAEGWEDTITSPASQDDHLALADVAEAMDELPADQRDVLLAAGLEGRAQEDIARDAGCPVGTIKSRLSRARARLRDRVGDHDALPLAA